MAENAPDVESSLTDEISLASTPEPDSEVGIEVREERADNSLDERLLDDITVTEPRRDTGRVVPVLGERRSFFGPCLWLASKFRPADIRWRLSQLSFRRCVCFQRRRDYLALAFMIVAYSVLYPGLFFNVIHLKQETAGMVDQSSRSTWETVRFMLTKGGEFLFPGILLLFFSVIVPFLKGALLVIALVGGRKPKLLRFVARISKYQLVDIFVTILLIGFLNNKFITAEVREGFYYFLCYCLCSIIGTTILATGEDTRESVRPVGLVWGILVVVMLSSLCALLFMPLFHIGPTYKGHIVVDIVDHSMSQLIWWLLTNGCIPEALLLLVGVILLPIFTYVLLPLVDMREDAKARLISISHEWALADTWLIAFLVGWTSFDTNTELNVQVHRGGTYFNLVYGFSAFIIIYFIMGEATVLRLSGSRIALATEQGEDIQVLARQIDRRNQRRTSSTASILLLGLIPGALYFLLYKVEGIKGVDIKWLNEELKSHYDDINKLGREHIPDTIGCCVKDFDTPGNCSEEDKTYYAIPQGPKEGVHPDMSTCIPVGDKLLRIGKTTIAKGSINWGARWLTNLRSIQLKDKDNAFHISSTNTTGQPKISFTVRGRWNRLPMSIYATAYWAPNYVLDNAGHQCCEENEVQITVEVACHSDFPFMRDFAVREVKLAKDEKVVLPFLGFNYTLENLTGLIAEEVEAKITEYATKIPFPFWPNGRKVTFLEALNHFIKVNIDGTELRCPAPSDDTLATLGKDEVVVFNMFDFLARMKEEAKKNEEIVETKIE